MEKIRQAFQCTPRVRKIVKKFVQLEVYFLKRKKVFALFLFFSGPLREFIHQKILEILLESNSYILLILSFISNLKGVTN